MEILLGEYMSESNIKPEKITKPIQLLAVWFAGLISLVSAFLLGTRTISHPYWMAGALGITAISIVPVFVGLVFLLQTRFRPHIQDDEYYSEWEKRQEEAFKDFSPENINASNSLSSINCDLVNIDKLEIGLEEKRISIYNENKGLFLVHSWRPSKQPNQIADISIYLTQHNNGPLNQGIIRSVEYSLGPKFFSHPIVKKNINDNFRLNISAYGPVLCLAKVNFTDNTPSISIYRYINF